MRWTTARVTIFCLSLSLATACASVVAQQNSNMAVNSNYQADVPATNETEPPVPLEEQSDGQYTDGQAVVRFEPLEVMGSGSTSAESIRLRESPEANVAGSAVVKLTGNASFDILGWTRDYLRVRIPAEYISPDDEKSESAREGWVSWSEVEPGTTAIVIDAETGAVVSRLPFPGADSGVFVAFSPDNSRAVFYGDQQAYEVKTEDYTLTRSFKTRFDNTPFNYVSFFYGSTDNTLYAALGPSNYSTPESENLLNIVRVDMNEPAPAPLISERAVGFTLSPDGRTGFILHPANTETDGMLVDVLDLQGMRVSHTLTLRGENLPTSGWEFVTNADGSELYRVLGPNCEAISVIDTRTGQRLREIPNDGVKERSLYLSRQELVGNSFFFRVWDEEAAESRGVLLDDGGTTSETPRGIDYMVEANGVRMGVNDTGTHLFTLDAENRISEKRRIERPDVRPDQQDEGGLIVHRLVASPDGKRLIVVLGFEHGC